ncbi:LutC/YkgG family protein [Alicyclobacillus fastidiosus]|uniref:LUD domain-containing protein n=1 Tax=Alicyclobacillus fastidiosus TaxID=392011 RepID=A0ABV5AIN6_9BACL|nr:LUD domain-containing protein [Alicyclobacillus fastidiosus]WEH07802.1 LUD domain-containing protein [Alicyclobacillus fastidiosus]
MNRDDFLRNIATRLGRTPGASPSKRSAVGVPQFWSERKVEPSEVSMRFVDTFQALGGELESFETEDEVRNRLDDLLRELSASAVGAWGRTAGWPFSVESVLNSWDAVRWDETTPAEFAHVQVSITGCMFAIADTGTIAIASSQVQGRGVHVLPSVHIVILRESQIKLRLGEVLAWLSEQNGQAGLPASVHFVSGPSRSSDIENDQSIGVHGPARVIALMLKD